MYRINRQQWRVSLFLAATTAGAFLGWAIMERISWYNGKIEFWEALDAAVLAARVHSK
jgi:hypothetical protein